MVGFEECGENEKPPSQQDNDTTWPPKREPSGTCQKQESTPDKNQANPVNPPPDGGLQAWLQVLGGFAIYFNTWGLIAAFGVFQTYYESGALFHSSASNIAWIGAIQASLTFFTNVIAGPVFDRGYLRALLATGCILVILGFMMVSICKTLYQLILAQGICMGVGSGMLLATVPPLISQYFSRHLGLANGLFSSGSAIGGIIYPIAFRNLLTRLSFGWSVRILAFIALATLLPPLLFMRRRFKPSRPRAFFDRTILSDTPYLLFAPGLILCVIATYSVLFFISSFSLSSPINASPSLAFYILAILNAGSLFGRVLPTILADHIGALNVMPAGSFICALLIFCMIAVKSTSSLIVMAVLLGFFTGIFIALPPMALVVLTKDRSKTGTRVGIGIGCLGFGALAGGPGGGSVLQDYGKPGEENWTALWVYGGVTAAAAGIFFLAAAVCFEREKRRREKEEKSLERRENAVA